MMNGHSSYLFHDVSVILLRTTSIQARVISIALRKVSSSDASGDWLVDAKIIVVC